MGPKKTLLIGASENKERYSYLAINSLRNHYHPVFAIGNKEGKVGDTIISVEKPVIENIDTITLYLNAQNQKAYYDYIISLHPTRLIFNPGAENKELAEIAAANGIEPLEACTLVLLSTGQY